MGLVYRALNIHNNKSYIGITKQTLEKRMSRHKNNARNNVGCRGLTNAINKYGINSFIWGVLEDDIPTEQLGDKERYYIDKYDSKDNGYNISDGGEHVSGYKWSVEARDRLSSSLKKYHLENPEAMFNVNRVRLCGADNPAYGKRYNLGKKHSQESKDRMSESARGRVFSAEHKLNLSISHRGYEIPCEQREKISKALSGENAPSGKLLWEDVNEIRKLYVKGVFGYGRLAKRFNVSKTTIYRILNNKIWVV